MPVRWPSRFRVLVELERLTEVELVDALPVEGVNPLLELPELVGHGQEGVAEAVRPSAKLSLPPLKLRREVGPEGCDVTADLPEVLEHVGVALVQSDAELLSAMLLDVIEICEQVLFERR